MAYSVIFSKSVNTQDQINLVNGINDLFSDVFDDDVVSEFEFDEDEDDIED